MTKAAAVTEPATTAGGVLITGAGRRIGRALALDLGARGWRVAVHCNRSRAGADEVVGLIGESGGTAAVVVADLAREGEVAGLVAAAAEAVGPLSALINNASRFERDAALTATRAEWDGHMEVNLRAPFVLTQTFVRQLPEGAEGCVINILDQAVWNLTPHFTTYTVSKAALWTLTQTLALALAPRVRVNAIGPGPVLPSARQTQAQFDRMAASVPLGRATPVGDIAEAVRFLLSARSVTGQMLALDGGEHLGWAQAPASAGPQS